MENSDLSVKYMQEVKDSQFYTDLEMIKRNIESIKDRLICPDKGFDKNQDRLVETSPRTRVFYLTSLEEEVDYFIKGMENTISKYKMIELENGK